MNAVFEMQTKSNCCLSVVCEWTDLFSILGLHQTGACVQGCGNVINNAGHTYGMHLHLHTRMLQ